MRRGAIRGIISALAVLGMAVLLSPRASATIIYSICSSGCTANTGSYVTTQAQAPSLTYSSAISFTAANLNNGVYLDPTTGTTLTAFLGGATVDTNATVNGSSFKQAGGGNGSGIEIDLPANTYAISLNLTAFGGAFGGIAIGDHSVLSQGLFTTGGFVSLVSDTPLGSIFIGPTGGGSFQVDNFQTGTLTDNGDGGGGTDATPEPSTLILLGSGLLATGLIRRRPRRID